MIIRNIALIMAMQEEAKPIIENFKMRYINNAFGSSLPFELYKGTIKDNDIHLILSGKDKIYKVDNIATQPATLSTYLTIELLKPDLIINAGTAGGFYHRGAKIGTVYISNGLCKYHDRRIPIPGFREYGIGDYPTIKVHRMAKDLHLTPGIITTGNSLDISDKDMEIIRGNNADVKDMEAAAIAWLAMLYKIPFCVVKSITDLIDSNTPTQEEFIVNLATASNNLCKAVVEIISYCLNKSISDL